MRSTSKTNVKPTFYSPVHYRADGQMIADMTLPYIKKAGSRRLHWKKEVWLIDHFHVYRVRSFLSLLYIKFYPVVLFNLVYQPVRMHKRFFFRIVMLNKTKSFFFIKELYSSLNFCAHKLY